MWVVVSKKLDVWGSYVVQLEIYLFRMVMIKAPKAKITKPKRITNSTIMAVRYSDESLNEMVVEGVVDWVPVGRVTTSVLGSWPRTGVVS